MLEIFSGTVFYCISGAVIDNNDDFIRKNKRYCVIFALLAIVLDVIFPFAFSTISFATGNGYADGLTGSVGSLLPIAVFLLIKIFFDGRLEDVPKLNRAVLFLGKHCFGIYLLEQFSRAILIDVYKYMINVMPGVAAAFIYAALAFALSLFGTMVLKKIPGMKKII